MVLLGGVDLIRVMLVMLVMRLLVLVLVLVLVFLRVVMLVGFIASACMIERACIKGLGTR
jgi:hypothetical protein